MPKSPDRAIQRLVEAWIRKAEADIRLAEHLLEENAPFWDAIAFHCQQGAEKYLKAFLVGHQVEFPKTHNIRELLGYVATVDKRFAQSLKPSRVLTPYGVVVRYPDDIHRVDRKKAETALGLAQKVEKSILGKFKRIRK